LDGVGVKGYGEGSLFAEFVLHGADGFVEGVDDEVDGSGAGDLADVDWIVVDG
jgi:hypothetical protein